MTKKEMLEVLENVPDEAEILIPSGGPERAYIVGKVAYAGAADEDGKKSFGVDVSLVDVADYSEGLPEMFEYGRPVFVFLGDGWNCSGLYFRVDG